MKFAQRIFGILLLCIGIGISAPSLLDNFMDPNYHYRPGSIPGLFFLATLGGAAVVGGIWLVMASLKRSKPVP